MSGSAELILGTNGVNPDMKAQVRESFLLDERGAYVQVRVTNSTGRLTVRSVGIEAARADLTEGSTSE